MFDAFFFSAMPHDLFIVRGKTCSEAPCPSRCVGRHDSRLPLIVILPILRCLYLVSSMEAFASFPFFKFSRFPDVTTQVCWLVVLFVGRSSAMGNCGCVDVAAILVKYVVYISIWIVPLWKDKKETNNSWCFKSDDKKKVFSDKTVWVCFLFVCSAVSRVLSMT